MKDFWKSRVINEYPLWVQNKPQTLNWRDYYIFLAIALLNSWKILVYLNGDVIGQTLVSSKDLNYAINDIVSKFIQEDERVRIIFVNEDIQPVLIVGYPDLNYEVRSEDFSEIRKVVITFDNIRYVDAEFIFEELTSRKSQRPVFEYLNDQFYIIDKLMKLFDYSISNIEDIPVQSCDQYDNEDLIHYLWLLDRTINKKYLYDTYGQYPKDQLCLMIRTKLEQIGHIIPLRGQQ